MKIFIKVEQIIKYNKVKLSQQFLSNTTIMFITEDDYFFKKLLGVRVF